MYQPLDNCSPSTGSESNINSCTTEKSLRNQLLRRILHKGYLELDHRSNSWSSPPAIIRRSQQQHHRLTPGTPPPDICKECAKFEQQISPKRVKLLPSSSLSPSGKRNIIDPSKQKPHSLASSQSSIATTVSESSNNLLQHQQSSLDNQLDKNETTIPTSVDNVIESDINENINETKKTVVHDDCINNNNNHNYVNDNVIETPMEKDANKNILSASDSLSLSSKSTVEKTPDSDITNEPKEINSNFTDNQFVSKLLMDQLNKSLLDIIELKDNNSASADEKSQSDKNSCATSTSISVNCIPTSGDTENTELHVASSGVWNTVEDARPKTLPITERKIYFPSYSMECKEDDQSICCTPQSSEKFIPNSTANDDETISVHTGSCYPNQNYTQPIVVSRSIYRTESTEAQPSTASTRNNDATAADEDSDESLVDSLDDPVSPTHKSAAAEHQTPIKHSESFFVPITNDDDQPQSTDDINVTISMPDKIRKKLIKRHQFLDDKKLHDNAKKQTKLEKAINRSKSMDDQAAAMDDYQAATSSSSVSLKEKSKPKSSVAVFTTNAGKTVLSSINSVGNKFFRSEIGLLETYTIDAKGNMQFQEPKKLGPPPSVVKRRNNVIKPIPIRKQQTTTTTTTNVVKMKRTKTKKSYSAKELNHKQQQQHSEQRCREVIKDVKQVTLYQAADIITPDNDCGPKRMYQKTEISDGEKRIEILEIVECIESSSCSEGSGGSYSSHDGRDHDTTIAAAYIHQPYRKSKIPIPITTSNQSNSAQKSSKTIRSSSSSSSSGGGCGTIVSTACGSGKKMFIRNMHQISSNAKVDEMIADLLIDALNNQKDLPIDYIKSPKQLPLTGSKSFKRGSISSRRTTMQDRSRHSANNSAPKYHQVFEVIPEEKSGLSVDSSNEDVNNTTTGIWQTTQSVPTTIHENLNDQMVEQQIGEISDSMTVNSQDLKVETKECRANGKAAVQDEYAEPKAWMGFFKQHDESSVDSGNEGKTR